MSTPNDKNTLEPLTFAAFLEEVPPGAEREVSDLIRNDARDHWILKTPNIRLYCPEKSCGGVRFFERPKGSIDLGQIACKDVFLDYSCRNCEWHFKTFALHISWDVLNPGNSSGSAVKYGEMPPFGPPLPPRLLSMAGADGYLLRKGRRAENQSLGIGALAYYRRVVENQKDRLLEEIRKAAERLGADKDLLESIDRAKEETQFSTAIKLVKDAIPEGLKVQGENPLTLLHRVLSRAVHGLDDRECLERAQAVRRVLTELVSNIAQVTKDKRELTDAVKKLRSIK